MFFFKQKTAYEMLRSLVGSEMCIRDRLASVSSLALNASAFKKLPYDPVKDFSPIAMTFQPVSYTHLTLPTIYSV